MVIYGVINAAIIMVLIHVMGMMEIYMNHNTVRLIIIIIRNE